MLKSIMYKIRKKRRNTSWRVYLWKTLSKTLIVISRIREICDCAFFCLTYHQLACIACLARFTCLAFYSIMARISDSVRTRYSCPSTLISFGEYFVKITLSPGLTDIGAF